MHSHTSLSLQILGQRQDCRRSTACSLICRLSVGICRLLVDASEIRGRWTKRTDLPIIFGTPLPPCRPSAQFRFVAALTAAGRRTATCIIRTERSATAANNEVISRLFTRGHRVFSGRGSYSIASV